MFEIIKRRKIWYLISALIIIPGLISLFTQGLNLGIDFTGGNIVEIKFDQNISTAQVRKVVENEGLTSNYIQESSGNVFLIRTEVTTEEQNTKFLRALNDELGSYELLRNDRVGPTVGKELTQKAIVSLAIAAVLMIIYITWRFEFKQGVAAVVPLLHDVLVTVGILSITQLEVDSSLVAVILTIIGYSINATIVIFDRIRENLHMKKGMKLEELIDTSLWQTMARSINTTLTVLFVLVALYLFGGSTISTFVLALIIGVTSGLYSSIFIASSIWYDILDSRRKGKKAVKAA
ncbi:protein translocase subunit SecF [Peptococcaceae bacterium 1198_IL3148]